MVGLAACWCFFPPDPNQEVGAVFRQVHLGLTLCIRSLLLEGPAEAAAENGIESEQLLSPR